MCARGECRKFCEKTEKTSSLQAVASFHLEKSRYCRLSHIEQKCMKFPAVLFSNYCHRCLPLNWPRLSQHALLVSVSYNCCLQLLSKRGRDSAAQLQGKCHSHAPLAFTFPTDEEKCIHCWESGASDI